jgi:hypothetical protein
VALSIVGLKRVEGVDAATILFTTEDTESTEAKDLNFVSSVSSVVN